MSYTITQHVPVFQHSSPDNGLLGNSYYPVDHQHHMPSSSSVTWPPRLPSDPPNHDPQGSQSNLAREKFGSPGAKGSMFDFESQLGSNPQTGTGLFTHPRTWPQKRKITFGVILMVILISIIIGGAVGGTMAKKVATQSSSATSSAHICHTPTVYNSNGIPTGNEPYNC